MAGRRLTQTAKKIFKRKVVASAGDLTKYDEKWTEKVVRDWIKLYGGSYSTEYGRNVTHLIATKELFAKNGKDVKEAKKKRSVKILTPDWFKMSMIQNKLQPEGEYDLRAMQAAENKAKNLKKKEEKANEEADEYVNTNQFHPYTDSTYFRYEIILTRDDGHRYLLTLFESNAQPPLYLVGYLYYKKRGPPAGMGRISDTAGSLQRELDLFDAFFTKKTGVWWDFRVEEADVNGVVTNVGKDDEEQLFKYQIPTGGKPIGLVRGKAIDPPSFGKGKGKGKTSGRATSSTPSSSSKTGKAKGQATSSGSSSADKTKPNSKTQLALSKGDEDAEPAKPAAKSIFGNGDADVAPAKSTTKSIFGNSEIQSSQLTVDGGVDHVANTGGADNNDGEDAAALLGPLADFLEQENQISNSATDQDVPMTDAPIAAPPSTESTNPEAPKQKRPSQAAKSIFANKAAAPQDVGESSSSTTNPIPEDKGKGKEVAESSTSTPTANDKGKGKEVVDLTKSFMPTSSNTLKPATVLKRAPILNRGPTKTIQAKQTQPKLNISDLTAKEARLKAAKRPRPEADDSGIDIGSASEGDTSVQRATKRLKTLLKNQAPKRLKTLLKNQAPKPKPKAPGFEDVEAAEHDVGSTLQGYTNAQRVTKALQTKRPRPKNPNPKTKAKAKKPGVNESAEAEAGDDADVEDLSGLDPDDVMTVEEIEEIGNPPQQPHVDKVAGIEELMRRDDAEARAEMEAQMAEAEEDEGYVSSSSSALI